jgi:hypothetical protein
MRRRDFLVGLTAGALAAPARATQPLNALDPGRVLLIVPDIGPSTDPAMLEAALQALVEQGLPTTLVIRPWADGTPDLTPGAGLADLLRGYAARFPGLMEIAAWAPGLGHRQPFQVARDAMEARSGLIAALWGSGGHTAPSAPIVTIATDFLPDMFSVADVLSAGFQNVLALPLADTPVEAGLSPGGVLTLSGGSVTDPGGAEGLVAGVQNNRQALLILPAGALGPMPGPAIARLATATQVQELAGTVTTLLTRDLQMRTDAGYRRRLALHLFDAVPGDAGSKDALIAFRQKLDRAQIRYSVGEPLGQATSGWPPDDGYWIALGRGSRRSAATPSGVPLTRVRRTDVAGWQSAAPLPLGMAVVLSADPFGVCGPDDMAVMHVPVVAFPGELSTTDALREGVLVIDPQTIASEAQRNLAFRALRDLADGGVAEILPLDRFAAERLPDDRLLPAFLRTDRRQATRGPSVNLSEVGRTELLADAAVAWSYFAKATSRVTGLSPSTTVGGNSATDFVSVTMWEAGSQINASMAALDLGLIDNEDFTLRIKMLLKTLERSGTGNRTLPPEWIDTDTGRMSRDFNSFDTGRLLVALGRLRRHRLAPAGIDKIVAAWDFAKVIQNRRLHSVKSGALVDDFNSNYTEYAASGFRAWGHDVASPFESLTRTDTADERMALLYTVARIGPIGAEPSLLELIDSGPSPTADYLADVLFAAQADVFDRTGQLIYPSESPIDRPPWFAFQGYSVDAGDDPWTIKFDREDAEFQTAAFRQATRANSPKAAYLWQALRPGEISARMVAKSRALARAQVGFLSAIYLQGEAPTLNYSDLNTNSVILQAIAHMV